MPLEPGETFGRYVLEDLLGTGATGGVYRALDTLLERRVALKVLAPSVSPFGDAPISAEDRARILREARAAARITHPNAVAIFDVGEVDGVPFLAMELVAGRTLTTFIGDASVSLVVRTRWLAAIARGLEAAHALGIVHRDVKPDNVMVCDDGGVKVLDFGIARRKVAEASALAVTGAAIGEVPKGAPQAGTLGTLTAQGMILGTPLYMAPEQMRGEALDGRADQFSWGVMAYEVLTGRVPWEGPPVQAVSEILTREVGSLVVGAPEIAVRVDEVVQRALKKSPQERFASMGEIAEALEGYAEPEGDPASVKEEALALARTEHLPAATGDAARLAREEMGARGSAKRARARAVGIVLGVVALVVGGFVVSRLRGGNRAVVRRPAVDAGVPFDARSRMSANAEATAAYREGVGSLHDAALEISVRELSRAIELDPTFAAAHLRRALVNAVEGLGDTNDFKEDIQQARNSRADLGGHDWTLLDAFEPWTLVPPDFKESQRRLERAERDHPADADFQFARGLALDMASEPALARAAFDAASASDPTSALVWDLIGSERANLGDNAGAADAFNHCSVLSPRATSCLNELASLQANEGECDELARTSQRIIAFAPSSPTAYLGLADGLAGRGQPAEVVRATLQKHWDRQSPEQRASTQAENEAALALLVGDFSGADRALALLERLTALEPDERAHFSNAYPRMLLDLETGHRGDAVRRAKSYLRRRSAWAPLDGATIRVHAVEFAAGGISRATFDDFLAQWFASTPNPDPALRIAYEYAGPGETSEEAARSLRDVADVHAILSALYTVPEFLQPIGRMLVLAGRRGDALPVER